MTKRSKGRGELRVPPTVIGEHLRKLALAYGNGQRAEGIRQAGDVVDAEVHRVGAARLLEQIGKGAPVAGDDVGRLERVTGRLEELCADLAAFTRDKPRELPEILRDGNPIDPPIAPALIKGALRAGALSQPGPALEQIEKADVEDLADEGAELEDGEGADETSSTATGLRIVLAAIIAGEGNATQRLLCVLTGYKGRTVTTYVSRLRARGYVGAGELRETRDGVAWLGDYTRPPKGAALIDWWRRRLGHGGERQLFDLLVQSNPKAMTHSDLVEVCPFKARTVTTYLSRLTRRKLIVKHGRAYGVADELGLGRSSGRTMRRKGHDSQWQGAAS